MNNFFEDNLPSVYRAPLQVDRFYDLPQEVQDDLKIWLNFSPDDNDRELMTSMYTQGRFKAWSCPICNEPVLFGEPEDWDQFQGVRNADYVSYPGNTRIYQPEFVQALCDHCRMSL